MSSDIIYPNESTITLKLNSFENGLNTLKDPNLTNINYAIDIQNFSFNSGALKPGLGFKNFIEKISNPTEQESIKLDLESIGNIEKMFHFYIYNQEKQSRDDKIIFVNYEHKLYYINLYDNSKSLIYLRNIDFTSSPNAVRYRLNGEDVMIFCSTTDNMVVWNGYSDPYEILDAPKISSMAIHYERLFATVDGEKNAVWFSDDLDPTNWSISLDEAGFIEMIDERGALLKVVSFCDYLYIFREHGISRLSAYGNQENFSVSNLFVSSGKIYAESVCVCGDEIIFLASDGLYKFDGLNTIKILSNISENLSDIHNQNVSSCYYNGCYYLACNFKFLKDDDDCLNKFFSNCLLEIDITSHKLKNITHGVNIRYLASIHTDIFNGVVVLASDSELNNYLPTIIDNSGYFLSTPLNKVWHSPNSIINDISKLKSLKKIHLQTSNNIFLTIFHDDHESKFHFKGSKLPVSKITNLQFNSFAFKIESDTPDCNIKNLQFEFYSTTGRL